MKEAIEKFFSSSAYAVVGVSADQKKFGNKVFRTMRERGFEVYPIHPKQQTVEGVSCFPSILEVPKTVKSIVTVVPPQVTEEVLVQSAGRGIDAVWMQPGSESKDAVEIAQKYHMAVVYRECILMFLEPVRSVHALHKFIKKLVGTYPT
jgi:predicted CoA-binding protein